MSRAVCCPVCNTPERVRFRWRGYYRLRCMNGHRSKIATPKQAARNFAQATRGTEAS